MTDTERAFQLGAGLRRALPPRRASRRWRGATSRSGIRRTVLVVSFATLLLAGVASTLFDAGGRTAPEGASGARAAGAPSGLDCATQNTVATLSVVLPSPASGRVGSRVTLQGSGFFDLDSVFLFFSPYPGTGLAEVGSVPARAAEPFEETVVVPGSSASTLGPANFWALDAASNCASAGFNLTGVPPSGVTCVSFGASLTVTAPVPATGPAGSTIDLEGTGFYPEGGIALTWAAPGGAPSSSLGFGSGESFTTSVTVPAGYPAGSYLIWGVDGIDDCAAAGFNLTGGTAPTLALAPASGAVGTLVTATGSGYAADSSVTFTFDGLEVASVCETDGTGSFPGASGTPCQFEVPGAPDGDEGGGNVVATDASSNSAAASFNVTPALLITSAPTTGAAGTPVTANGSGWTPGDLLSVGVGPAGSGSPTVSVACEAASGGEPTVNASGGFSCAFAFPSLGPGVYSVLATDLSHPTDPITNISSSNAFTIPVAPRLSVSPSSGPAGTEVTLTGTGFSPYPAVATLSFEGGLIVPTGGSDCDFVGPLITLDAVGGFVCTWTVPSSATVGPYEFESEDTATGDLSPATGFTVTLGVPTVSVSASPSPLSLKESTLVTVTVSGSGPIPTGAVAVSDGLSGAKDSCIIFALNATGSGSCSLTPSQFGSLTVTASYLGGGEYETGVGTTPLFVNTVDLTLSPSSGSRDETLDVLLGGFAPASSGMLITVGGAKSEVQVQSWTISGPNSVTARVFVGLHAPLGLDAVAVSITTSALGSSSVQTLSMGEFRVVPLATTMSPTTGSQDETLDIVLAGFTPELNNTSVDVGGFKSGVTVDSLTITGLSRLTVEITIAKSAKLASDVVSVRVVTVSVVGEQRKTVVTDLKMGTFTVSRFAVSVTPSSGAPGQTLNVTLSGFTVSPSASDITVTFGSATSGIAVDTVMIAGLSSLTVEITISPTAPESSDLVTIVESVSGGPGTALSLTIAAFAVTA